MCMLSSYFVTFQIKSRTKAEGLGQLENAVYGLWADGQQSMIGVLSVDGKVSDYIHNRLHLGTLNLCRQHCIVSDWILERPAVLPVVARGVKVLPALPLRVVK